MASEPIVLRIHKKKALTVKPSKTGFRLPEANRFFARVMHDKGVLANSQYINEEEAQDVQDVGMTREDSSKPGVTRSASLQLSRKVSVKAEQKLLSQMQSLPKIQRKTLNDPPREIIKSQLGCFNYYDILRRKEEVSQKRLHGSHLTRLSSFISDEDALADNQSHAGQLDREEVKYQDYDKALMEQEPVVYRRRAFKLKHKADWSISK